MDKVWIEGVLSLGVGVGLAAAAGLRVFLPLLVLGLAGRFGGLPLSDGFEWLATGPAIATLGAATVLEIGAYYVPWIDNLLDVVAGPSAIAAGIVATAAAGAELPPAVRWAVAIVAGGGTAGIVQSLTTVARLKSLAFTGGLGNPVLATVEWLGALVTAVIAIVLPAVALAIVAALILLARWIVRRFFRRTPVARSA